MRGVRVSVAVLGAWLATLPAARAGVYISTEAHPDEFQLKQIKILRGQRLMPALPDRPEDDVKPRYKAWLAALEKKEQAGTLTAVDRADLGGLYLRFNRPRDAARVLTAGHTGHFLVLCNLAVAYHELAVQELDINRLEEAVLTERRALAAWPPVWADWSDEQWHVNRRVELHQLRLLELRSREMRQSDGKLPVWQTVDDLFPGFRLVGPGGGYEAGRVALKSLDAVPQDALRLVRELMLAYPNDPRLYWLFGELLNAGGRVEDALKVFSELVDANQASNVRELVAHRRVVLERAALLGELRNTPVFRNEAGGLALAAPGDGTAAGPRRLLVTPVDQETLLWALAPRGASPVPVVGPAATEAAWWATIAALEELQREERLGRPVTGADATLVADVPAPARPSPPATAGALPDWRALAVGFAVGVVVTVIAGLQRSVWKQRRQAAVRRRHPVG